MLIDKSFKSGDIITLKLKNSEEIIAKLLVQEGNRYQVSNPRILFIDYSEANPRPGMMPLAFSCDTDVVDFKKEDVLFCKKSNKDFSKFYTAQTSSIQPATDKEKALIIGN